MKINVITLHAVKNYGSVLQSLATQEILQSYGFEVEFINYIREDCLDSKILETRCGKNIIKRIIMYPTLIRTKAIFNRFLKDYINCGELVCTYDEDFRKLSLDADIYCTGSDQVWNSGWNKGVVKPLFLDFVPSGKFKFAYSASFGKETLSKSEVDETYKLINEYKHISVREDYAKTILSQNYGYEHAVHVVDPTLAFDGDFWRKFAPKSKIKGDYILIYNLNRSKKFDKYAIRLAKKTGLPLVRFCTRYDQFYRPGKSLLVPEVFEFITYIDNAKYVLTDSFHGTAFSLNLNTHPLCIYPNEFGGRLESVLKMTNSLQCHVIDYEDFDVVNRTVDFDEVNGKLKVQRQIVRNYLDVVFTDFKNFSK